MSNKLHIQPIYSSRTWLLQNWSCHNHKVSAGGLGFPSPGWHKMIPRGLPSSHARCLLFPSPLPEITWEREENLWFQGLQVPGSQPPPPCTSCMLSVFSASLSQRCSSGFSLHMFLKLSWSASKRQMVVWLNIFPVRARQAGHYTPHSFPHQWLPRITTPKIALFLGDHERHSPCSFSTDLKP